MSGFLNKYNGYKYNGCNMPVINEINESKTETIIDDLNLDKELIMLQTNLGLDQNKLAMLKAKMNKKETIMPENKKRSIKVGVFASGQAGGNLGSCFAELGYNCVAINTASSDLESLTNLPEDNKLLLKFGLGGAARERPIGKTAAENYKEQIYSLVKNKLDDSDVFLLCASLGGGSGSGSLPVLIDILSAFEKPIVVLTILPGSSDDQHSKKNALEALAELSKDVQSKRIQNLILIDNAKIEVLFGSLSSFELYPHANRNVCQIFDDFNTFSSKSSTLKAIDGTEMLKIMIDGEGLSCFGEFQVNNYMDECGIAEGVCSNLSNNLLASGFDLKTAKYCGFILIANKETWKKIPSSSIAYANSMIGDLCGTPKGIFKGIYETNTTEDTVRVLSWWSGLGLPQETVSLLKEETKQLQEKVKVKEDNRNLTLQLDTGKTDTITMADQIKDRIKQKSSMFGKLTMSNNTIDKRSK